MTRRWRASAIFLLCGLVIGAVQVASGVAGAGAVLFLIFAVPALIVSPLAFPRSVTDAEARSRSRADGRPIVYWRPGCPFCLRLRTRLGRDASRAHWVDIWADPAGAATVRASTGGDETVPTVVFGGEALVNPDPERVKAMVRPS